MRRKRPLIGITTRHDLDTERFYLARAYADAVESAGGLPIHVPLIPSEEYITLTVKEFDGLLLPGSASDADPALYGEEPRNGLGAVHPLRDMTDWLIIEEAEKRALPILAICYGMQIVNVKRGGTLFQDIASEVPGALKHEQGRPRGRASHTLRLLSEGLHAHLSGANTLKVNSHHHQAVKTLGEHLRATAWSQDGLIEAYEETRSGRWVQGVQWHPEIEWENNEYSRALFSTFIEAAKDFRKKDYMGE